MTTDIEKILCYKSCEVRIPNTSKNYVFDEGKIYKCVMNGNAFVYILFYDEQTGIFFPKNNRMIGFAVSDEKFEDHFYTPAETVNVIRTELIDKILK